MSNTAKDKLNLILIMILISMFMFVAPTCAYTIEEITAKEQEVSKLQEEYENGLTGDLNKYGEQLDELKNTLTNMVLEEQDKENKIELQKIKLDITKLKLSFDQMIKINNLESELVKYLGYQSPILNANGGSQQIILTYGGSSIYGKISFKGTAGVNAEMSSNPTLFCQQHGGSLTSVMKSKAKSKDGKDATLIAAGNGVNYSRYMQELYQIGAFKEVIGGKQYVSGVETDFGTYNYIGSGMRGKGSELVEISDDPPTTRTIAKFPTIAYRTLENGEAYILAHAKDNSGTYPSFVQQAFWQYQNGQGSSSTISGGADDEDASDSGSPSAQANQLAAEAIQIETFMANGQRFNVSNTTSNFITTYSFEEKCYYVGPFSLSYVRQTLASNGSIVEPLQRAALKNHVEGLIEFSGINDITCYDESGSVLSGIQYIITKGVGRQPGDNAYKFPYPNEEFYVKIPDEANPNATVFQRMTIEIFNMEAEGNGYDLNGKYDIQKFGTMKVATACSNQRVCKEHGRTSSHSWFDHWEFNEETQEWDIPVYNHCYGPFNWCQEHGTKENHVDYWTHYIVSLGPLATGLSAQKLLGAQFACIKIIFSSTTVEIDQRLTMDLEGTVWDDEHSGKESDYDGIKGSNEKGIKGVKVTAKADGKEVKSTYTGEDGKWALEKLKPLKYDIEFEYDGQTYKTTKLLASGGQDETTSKAAETEEERQDFNDKFYEITENTAIDKDGTKNALQYNTQDRVSKIVTRDSSTNIPLDLYKLQARTSSNGKYYPADDYIAIDTRNISIKGKTYQAIYPTVQNIDLGLVKRAEADMGLSMDIEVAHVRIKEIFQEFTYNTKNIDEFVEGVTDKIENGTYENLINKADYNWQWDSSLEKVYENADSAELQVYIDYKIVIRNQSQIASTKITELVNYYDEELVYDETTAVSDISSWIEIPAEGEEPTKQEIKWDDSASKYGTTKKYDEYKSMYTTSLEGSTIEPGGNIEIHILYAVGRETVDIVNDIKKIIMDDDDEGKRNVLEINGYQTYVNNKVEGKIDRDSNPGNAIPQDYSQFEDDTDKAPYFKIIFDPNKSNVIEGNVWKDLRTETLENGQLIGNGIRNNPEVEPNIGGVIVELVEIYKDPDTEKELERVVAQTTTAYTASGAIPNGGYRFADIPQGTYQVRFIYGTGSQLSKDLTYNGQDYQATILNGKIEQSKSVNIEIAFVIDTSGSMGGGKLTSVQSALSGKNKLIHNLLNTIQGIKIGLVRFTSSANIIEELTEDYNSLASGVSAMSSSGGTNIASGVIKGSELLAKGDPNATKIMVVLTDGGSSPEPARIALNQAKNNGIIPIAIMAGSSASTSIFGTPEKTSYGPVYVVEQKDIVKTFTEDIYADIEEHTIISPNCSYALEDIIGEKEYTYNINESITTSPANEIKSRTRLDNIQYYKEMNYERAMILSIDYIKTLQVEEKKEAIKTLSETTYITATTNKLRVRERIKNKNDTETSEEFTYLRQINLGLVERPETSIKLEEKVKGVQVILSNGTTLIDTEKGLNNYVQGLDKEMKVPVSISLDSELQQGATIIVKYQITITNQGEIDTLESYFNHNKETVDKLMEEFKTPEEKALSKSYFENDETVEKSKQSTIPTVITGVYSYISSNMRFRKEDNRGWDIVSIEGKVSEEVGNNVAVNNMTPVTTAELNKVLYPETSWEVKNGQSISSVTAYLTLSKVISSQDENDQLTYNNVSEIISRYNTVARRDYEAIPGNHVPYNNLNNSYCETDYEIDCDKAQEIIIVPPYGEQRVYYVLIASVVMILLLGTVLIKKYVLGKDKM